MKKRLYRSRKEKMIGGVAGGFAEYFDIDPVLARLAMLLLIFFNGLGVILYIICMIVIPQEPLFFENIENNGDVEPQKVENNFESEAKAVKKQNRQKTAGIVLITLGFFFLLDNLIPAFSFEHFFPVIVICGGVWLLINAQHKERVQNEKW
ncbi:MAG: PspC domain-containing protein [Ignavibacteriaceae bacterium]|nr:PspC domain-containing protein [Ignavibacteriaceae bacterium]